MRFTKLFEYHLMAFTSMNEVILSNRMNDAVESMSVLDEPIIINHKVEGCINNDTREVLANIFGVPITAPNMIVGCITMVHQRRVPMQEVVILKDKDLSGLEILSVKGIKDHLQLGSSISRYSDSEGSIILSKIIAAKYRRNQLVLHIQIRRQAILDQEGLDAELLMRLLEVQRNIIQDIQLAFGHGSCSNQLTNERLFSNQTAIQQSIEISRTGEDIDLIVV